MKVDSGTLALFGLLVLATVSRALLVGKRSPTLTNQAGNLSDFQGRVLRNNFRSDLLGEPDEGSKQFPGLASGVVVDKTGPIHAAEGAHRALDTSRKKHCETGAVKEENSGYERIPVCD